MRQLRYYLLLGVILVGVIGCSGGKPVNAIVTLDGKALAGATVVLVPEEGKESIPINGTTETDGSVVLTGPRSLGVPNGSYKVLITKRTLGEFKGDPKESPASMKEAVAKAKSEVPGRYGMVKQTPLKVKVPPESEPVTFALTSKP